MQCDKNFNKKILYKSAAASQGKKIFGCSVIVINEHLIIILFKKLKEANTRAVAPK